MALQPFRNVVRDINPNAARDAFQTAQTDRFVNTTRKNVLSEFTLGEPVRAAQRTGAMDRAASERFLSGMQSVHAFLKAGNIPAAINAAQQHRSTIKSGDTANTDEVIRGLQSGNEADISEATGFLDQIFGAAQEGDTSTTSDIENFQFLKNLSEEDRALFFQAKRAGKITEVGGVKSVVSGGKATPLEGPGGPTSLQQEVNARKALAEAAEEGKQEAQTAAIAPKAEEQRVQDLITEAPEKVQRAEGRVDTADRVIEDIDDAIGSITPFTTGVTGKVLSILPGSDRRDLDSLYTTLKANIGIETLGELREQSKTGASGFGQLNEQELKAIQSAVSSLDADLSKPQQVRNLNKLRRHVMRQKILASSIANLNAGLMSPEQARVTVRRGWQDFDDQIDGEATDIKEMTLDELRKAAGLD